MKFHVGIKAGINHPCIHVGINLFTSFLIRANMQMVSNNKRGRLEPDIDTSLAKWKIIFHSTHSPSDCVFISTFFRKTFHHCLFFFWWFIAFGISESGWCANCIQALENQKEKRSFPIHSEQYSGLVIDVWDSPLTCLKKNSDVLFPTGHILY